MIEAAMQRSVDLNADIGEHALGGNESELLRSLSSANVCCGVHAGSQEVALRTMLLAKAAGVAVGAHPGLAGSYGRSVADVEPVQAFDEVVNQFSWFSDAAAGIGVTVSHVKVHGALYNQAEENEEVAIAIVSAVKAVDSTIIFFGLAGGMLLQTAAQYGFDVAHEFFADRTYQPSGLLTPRSEKGALVLDADLVAKRSLVACRDSVVVATDGTELPIKCDTICVHGDTENSAKLASTVRRSLLNASIAVEPVGRALK